MKITKFSLSVYLYVVLFATAILTRETSFQHLVIIVNLFILNLMMNYKYKISNRSFKNLSIIVIGLNIALVYISHYQIRGLGFDDGLINGFVYRINYLDDYNYYHESEILKEYWMDGYFTKWLQGVVPGKLFYGYYNIFVIYNALLKILLGNNVISLILFKLQFTVVSMHFMYLISVKYMSSNAAVMPVILMNIFPAYVQSNISFIRDNLILFFCLLVFYKISFGKLKSFTLLISIFILIYLRPYVGIPITLMAFTYRYITVNKLTFNRVVKFVAGVFSLVMLLGVVLYIAGYGFLGFERLRYVNQLTKIAVQDSVITSSAKNLMIYNLRYLFLGIKVDREVYFSKFLYDNLLGMSYLFIPLFALPSLLGVISKNSKIRKFNLMITLLGFGIQGVILYTFGWNVPRLYIPWIWGQFIVFAYLLERILKEYDKRMVINILGCYAAYSVGVVRFLIY